MNKLPVLSTSCCCIKKPISWISFPFLILAQLFANPLIMIEKKTKNKVIELKYESIHPVQH